ncbi:P-loop containing nucleoside triphosphate hydrolase protein [Lineolata rhizophorae]|uniref:P-loop containing nucleoside triphosphate hydrolase protein n=1 Tax=Lineolata rhizophorae TaxID=578093 RepID=A0A6A6NNC8_9PEZI|nr:P-loop containing nucleoside triphosphate hydrolase protein [Lineolata rhizophorae]
MAATNLNTSSLDTFRSSEQQNLLDDIDNLRHEGVGEFVFLPQIIVCGEQSSGKSSVLEGISGVPFPQHDTLCTRFPTEVVLRQAATPSAAVMIVPSKDASESDQARLNSFKQSLQRLEDIPDLVKRAKDEMGLTESGKAFSKDILRVEISGPDKPKLTIVDLPGLIQTDSKVQSVADVELITGLVTSYMENPKSVILAVVSAKNEYHNQAILRKARDVDPKGFRTLGLITKPDTLPPGSDSEGVIVDLASNNNIQFRLGWHVVKNRDYNERHWTGEERDRSEEHFFSKGAWTDLPRDMVGIGPLRRRLGKILLEQIQRYLPGLIEDIESNIQDCKNKLLKLGDSRDTPEKQRQFLLKLSQSFQTLCRAASDGSYEHPFFGNPASDGEYYKRLRAVVQNLNMEFSEVMRVRGYHRKIVDNDIRPEVDDGWEGDPSNGEKPLVMSRAGAIEWVRELLVRSRGRELPGSFNPLLVGELFRDQSTRWGRLSQEHVQQIWLASRDFLEKLLFEITDNETSGSLFTHWIDPRINERFDTASQSINRLLADRQKHPITYNHYYTENLQKIREKRQTGTLIESIQKHWGVSSDTISAYRNDLSISKLAEALSRRSQTDMDAFACSELLDSMEAYYKVAMKTFVDNVCIQVVEDVLIGDIWTIFSPPEVGQMHPDLIARIAAESTESQAQRRQLNRKLRILGKGKEICERHSTHSASKTVRARMEAKTALQDDAQTFRSEVSYTSSLRSRVESDSNEGSRGQMAEQKPPSEVGDYLDQGSTSEAPPVAELVEDKEEDGFATKVPHVGLEWRPLGKKSKKRSRR